MSIINNHEFYVLDTVFQNKHKEIFDFFKNQGVDVEINEDFASLKTILLSKDKDDYPYDFDPTFELELDNAKAFVLYLKIDGEVVATYAAQKLSMTSFIDLMKGHFSGTYEDVSDVLGTSAYSSCQWVSKDHRGKKLGRVLDHLKKHICFDLMKCTNNYAIHKEALTDYHTEHLGYSNSERLALIPNGDVGGAGEVIDKIYNITYTTISEWEAKQSDIKALYS
jgi:hypothetical protein|tara:strand:- start:69 stop:737 length:669 start_codon:yes stop_codon:yes gene_type:complete